MRATIRITNRTPYRTDHLRAFVVKAREAVFGNERKRLRVEFSPSRQHLTGLATIRGSWSLVRVPRNPDKAELAQIIIHELAHNAGAKGERWMRRSTAFGWGPGWRERVAWALDLPLDVKAPRLPAEPQDVLAVILANLDARERSWKTKAKRAATALRKLARQRAYYRRKLAALTAKGGAS